MSSEGKVIPVRVALRVRPLIPKERLEGCQMCLQFIPDEPQVIVGSDKAFTYDFVFSPDTPQEDVYLSSAAHLVKGLFKGYNATVLAYGQTGSGKTHTMGTGYIENSRNDELVGVVPRVVKAMFAGISDRPDYTFTVKVSFLEIHQEDLNDLLCTRKREPLTIRESIAGGIQINGLSEVQVSNYEETLECLERGSAGRTTGSTAMNATSSRSHAIFTIHMECTSKVDSNDCYKAKFHLVDLAGSERAKRTQAEGERFKEGVSINKGLLALGNVISALGEDNKDRSRHIPYRDSKLTRLLQDSLGGNSHTIMIACVSPADSNIEETINTLRYADRARKIKNKPVINRDPQAAEILRLKQLVQQMQMQMMGGGLSILPSGPVAGCTDTKSLVEKNKKLEDENHKLSRELRDSVDQTAELMEKLIRSEMMRDQFSQKLDDLKTKTGLNMTMLLNTSEEVDADPKAKQQMQFVRELHDRILELENENKESVQTTYNDSVTESESSPNNSLTEQYTTDHALNQARLGRELQEMNKIIAKKQELVEQMSLSDEQLVQLKQEHEKETVALEKEIKGLQKEKEELVMQLNTNKAKCATSKVSEQRRKRLQELEAKLTTLNKKLAEQGKMLKLKEQSDKQVTKLNDDIKLMKLQRVKLMKQMKEDAMNYQKWKQQKDKEVLQLKAKDRKRQCDMAKMEKKYVRQHNVLRRKAEEAAAANKRLKDALQKQRDVAEERRKQLETRDMTGVGNRMRKFINQELEVQVSIEESKHHMNCLIADRKELAEQVAKLRRQLDDPQPPKKKKLLNDSQSADAAAAEKEVKLQQLKNMEQEIDLRNAQITDFQQKMVDADNDDKSKSRWNQIHTLVEGKVGLNALFKMCIAAKLDVILKKNELKELQTINDEVTKNMEELEERMTEQRTQHDTEIVSLQKHHQDKTIFLLNQLKSMKNENFDSSLSDDVKARLQFQGKEIERLSSLLEELRKKEEECDGLKKEMTVMKYQGKKSTLMPMFTSPGGSPIATPEQVIKKEEKKVKVRKEPAPRITWLAAEEWEAEEEEEEDAMDADGGDNVVQDPDWHSGFTPCANKKNIIKLSRAVKKKFDDSDDSIPSLQVSCTCYKRNAACKNCLCVRNNVACSDKCKCSVKSCENRDTQDTSDDDDIGDSTSTLNQTFEVPAPKQKPSAKVLMPSNNANDSIEDFKLPEKPVRKRSTPPSSAESDDENKQKLDNSALEGGLKKRKRKLLSTSSSKFFDKPLV